MATAPSAANPVLRFGVFQLDTQTGELRKSGNTIKLRPQAAKVLAVLVGRPDQLVTREELKDQIWGQDTFVDFEHGLNLCIQQIRAALRDDADVPRYIETLPRWGYRFIAPVRDSNREQIFGPDAATVPAPAAPRRFRLRQIASLVAIMSVIVGAALVLANVRGWRTQLLGGPSSPVRSIAVLPLLNLTGDAAQDYFADGMTDALITDLAKIHALRVVSRNSIMQYKGNRKPMPQIARELNVDTVVEGAVTRSADRVRITAQLVEAAKDRHLWAETYERDLRDVLALQDEVARDIAEEVRGKLTPQEKLRLTSARAIDPAAYEAYLKGRYYSNKRTEEGIKKSIEYFQQAIEKDPSYPLGYAGLADAYVYLGVWDYVPPNEVAPKAKTAVLRALTIDDALPEGHATLGNVLLRFEWNWTFAEQEYRRAIELNPSLAAAHSYLGIEMSARGDFANGIAEIKRAHELDPLSLVEHYVLGNLFYQERQYDQAIEELRSALEMDRSAFFLHWSLGMNYAQIHMFKEAMDEAQAAVVNSSGSPLTRAGLAHAYAVAGKQAQARKIVEQLKHESSRRYVPARELAVVYADLGEKDQAFQWLEKAYQERDRGLIWLKTDPALDSLRSDPRYRDLLRRVGPPV
jgi:TolB-like protein/DNA-binding winged helix-turn-helix (wHTH) protein/Tfp pilus assembly protein PilF